jgi:dihydroflavonol-4-reductase
MLHPDENLRGARVLVTGAGGFLGVNIVAALRAHGFAVRAFVRRRPRGPAWAGITGVEWLCGDVCDPAALGQAMAGVQSVIHTAAVTQLLPRPRQEAFQVNVEGTRNVCRAALRAGVRRLVLTSSASTLTAGTADAPADERSPLGPHGPWSVYYRSKWQAEQVVCDYGRRGLPSVILCPAYVIGPRDDRPTTNAGILQAAWTPVVIALPGGINFVDVREVALAHVRALWLGAPGERYVLAGPYATYWDLAATVKRALGRPLRGFVLPRRSEALLAAAAALATAIWPPLARQISVPTIRVGYIAFHLSGRRADETLALTHRPLEETVADTLRWFGI